MVRQVTTLPVTEKNVGAGNWDTSRTTIDRVIIHTMVGTAVSAASRFLDQTSKVSTHYGVLLDGSLWHWVDEDNTAYHAGDYAMNQRSIGIEHEDNGDFNGVRPDILYSSSAKLVKDICSFYNIPIDRLHILKHSEVIATGCPDALDIDRIVREAAGNDQNLIDTLRADRDKNWNLYQGALNKQIELESAVAQKNTSIDSLTKENLQLKSDVTTATTAKQTATLALQKATNDLADSNNKLSICNGLLANRKDLKKFTTKELIKEIFSRFKIGGGT
jgi:hypothetical protein